MAVAIRVAFVALVVALAVIAVSASDSTTDTYTTKFDSVDVDKIVSNKRLLDNYYKCLMDQGPCGNDANALKKIIPDALKTKCGKCSEAQKKGADKVVRHLIKNQPDLWKNLKTKYDPEGIYERDNKEELVKHGITV